MMYPPNASEASTMIGAIELGIMWLKIICMSVAPRDFEASMKVCSRSARVDPRINWAEVSHPNPAKIRMIRTPWRAW